MNAQIVDYSRSYLVPDVKFPNCSNCQTPLPLRICRNSGGWFVGTVCSNDECVHINKLTDRLSHYYESKLQVQQALKRNRVRWLARVANINKLT